MARQKVLLIVKENSVFVNIFLGIISTGFVGWAFSNWRTEKSVLRQEMEGTRKENVNVQKGEVLQNTGQSGRRAGEVGAV